MDYSAIKTKTATVYANQLAVYVRRNVGEKCIRQREYYPVTRSSIERLRELRDRDHYIIFWYEKQKGKKS